MLSFRGVMFLVLSLLAAAGCRTDTPRFSVRGQLANYQIDTQVDSARARSYLQLLMGAELERPILAEIHNTLNAFDMRPLTNETLADLARLTSTDFAALYFAQRSSFANSALRDKFVGYAASPAPMPVALTSAVVVVFVPGLFYRSHPETKGDLIDAERVVRSLGVATTRVETLDAGTVEENAAIIADFITNYDHRGAQLVLVSASKGGPEVVLALSNLSPQDQRRIAAWVSIGGVLRGSPLADDWLEAPKSWLAWMVSTLIGASPDLVESLGTRRSKQRLADAETRLPLQLRVLHYVGVPLSGTVTAEVRSEYERLASLGPNDGITLLCDELLPRGRVIVDLGLDHRFSDPRIAEKTAALTRLTLELLREQAPRPSQHSSESQAATPVVHAR